jgi:hypothetical protein
VIPTPAGCIAELRMFSPNHYVSNTTGGRHRNSCCGITQPVVESRAVPASDSLVAMSPTQFRVADFQRRFKLTPTLAH